jgi:hypothetical protein
VSGAGEDEAILCASCRGGIIGARVKCECFACASAAARGVGLAWPLLACSNVSSAAPADGPRGVPIELMQANGRHEHPFCCLRRVESSLVAPVGGEPGGVASGAHAFRRRLPCSSCLVSWSCSPPTATRRYCSRAREHRRSS